DENQERKWGEKKVVNGPQTKISCVEQLTPQLVPRSNLEPKATLGKVSDDETIDTVQRRFCRHIRCRSNRQTTLALGLCRQIVSKNAHGYCDRCKVKRRNEDGCELDHRRQNLKCTIRYITMFPMS